MLQHRLSQFYLRGFAPRRGKVRMLQEFKKGHGFVRTVSAKQASAEADVFTLSSHPNPYAIEQLFQRIESAAAPVFELIRHRCALSDAQRHVLAQFASLFFIRSPRRTEEGRRIEQSITVEDVERYCFHPGTRMRVMLMKRWMTAGQYDREAADYVAGIRSGAYSMPQFGHDPGFNLIPQALTKWAQAITSMSWTIELADRDNFFVVADEPLMARRPGHEFDPYYVGIGRSDLNVEVTFPLSRSACLVATWRQPQSAGYRSVNSDRVDELNVRSVIGAHRMFFAAEQHERCDRYIAVVGNQGVTVDYPSNYTDFMIEHAWRR